MSNPPEVPGQKGFLAFCDLAKCSPDFANTHQLRSTAEQADWIQARIKRYHAAHTPWKEIAAAIHEWNNRPSVAEHHIGTIQL